LNSKWVIYFEKQYITQVLYFITVNVILYNMKKAYFNRWQFPNICSAVQSAPAVFVNGPRQVGKSTLVTKLMETGKQYSYISLDDISIRAAASADPLAFLRQFKTPVIIDEVQLAPELFRAIKLQIDQLRQQDSQEANGRFVLTGSSNIMLLSELADALVGRVRILTLLPLSLGEYVGKQPFIESFFAPDAFHSHIQYEAFNFEKLIYQATFPEIVLMQEQGREGWYRDYIATLLQRDIRHLAEIDKVTALPNLLKMLALRTASLLNDAAMAREVGLNTMTYRRYRILLQGVFLTMVVPPWFRNVGKRLTKSPKLFFYDTALLVHLLGISPNQLQASHPSLFGHILENFVASELMKQLTLTPRIALHHYRTVSGNEVDFVLEDPGGKLVGIEVKSSSKVTAHDFAGLQSLKEVTGKDFIRGIVLYTGNTVLSFGPDMVAVPVATLAGE
jgi:uncharacterized protein